MFNSPMLLDFNSSTQQKRSKITKACDNCRRRRVKCDGVPDGCSGCKAAKTQCVYTTSNTKRGPPKGYVEVIEDRLGKIENMLTSIVRKKKNTLPEASSSSSTDKATVSSSTAASASHTSQNNEDNEDSHDEDEDDGCASTYSNDLVKVKQQPASPALRPARSSTPSSRNIRSGSVAMSPLGRHSPLISRNHSITSLLPFSHDVLPHHSSQNDSSLVTNADIASLTSMFDKLGSTSVRTTVPFPWLGPEQSLQYGRNHLQFTLQSLEPSLPILTRSFTPTISPEQTLQLIESFFERFNIYLPIIHRPTFMKQWEQQNCPLCPQTPSSHPRNRPAQAEDIEAHNQHSQDPAAPISPLLLNALLAVAAKVPSTNSVTLEDRQHSGFLSQSFFDAARLLLDDFMDVPRVSTVQALCLMSQYHHQGQWKATRSSSYLSMAIRMAHELGLNRDPENIISGPEADGLRYLWWSMFILDHQFSSWLGLGLMMHDKESDVELPMAPTSSQQDLRGFICMVRLVKILGSVLQHSYSAQSLPPQFGGHDSMVSFIEGSLSSWLSNLAPEMRWQNPNVSKRGSPGSPLRSPPSIQASLAEANRAVALAKEAGEVYPAYLYIVYNTTLILLHRPYIVGAAGSPAAAQSNTICTGSGRAITDIAQGLDMEQCSYVVNRFALFALLQAGVIHAMNAVYDKRGSQVAMDYYKRTLNVLESFLNCSSYSGGVLEGIKILEQFLATTSQAAAEDEINQGGENMVQQESDALPSRKRRQFEAVPSMSQHSTTSVQYTPTLTRTLPISSMPQHIMTPTFSMMTSTTSDVTNGAINAPQLIYNLVAQQQQQQQQQQLTLDLKEQQKQQQLKIQQQHRLYQQMQTFGASVLNKPSEIKTESLLEQQQLQQQQLMRQQLQRQQQRQQSDMDLSMEAQQKMGQEQLGMGPMASTMTDGFDYDPTKFWIDFTDSGSNGTLNPAHIQQQDPSIASSRSMVEPQLSGSLWM
ncbi:fungal-specific transcription factor domain-domain-containing protein [Lobosporangium transversale]|uniref:Fungal-specific transcription factor domain-domain-containing protein n=1 Tax=Lobosporangium transversale TaxID=64571 RepID=A0A1Y2GR22_9FUNG|nr:fungal-specific transcription factor domain-domain-containing protein [Lobosporangium transversale]ORZ19304.1 fungal-specific transcription factor domain-domain-containing protein [Lobosporangium transversale]|eukprot:XP_021882472.1 fungal-specific transcription factor domain-domain-containing protein [Lobosporangium transversale]